MSDLFHVDQATADRWRADGRFVLFREGEMHWLDDKSYQIVPPAAMIEAAKPCATCGGESTPGYLDNSNGRARFSCPHCSDGQRRHPVTVPCPACRGRGRISRQHLGWGDAICVRCSPPQERHEWASGRISTGLLAVVEWGPWQIVESWIGSRTAPIPVACLSHDGFLDWRWSSDDLSLVGQFAIGGRIEVTP